MHKFESKDCWVIEDYLDDNLVSKIKTIIQENLSNLYKNKDGYSTTGKNAEQYWLINQEDNFFIKDSKFYDFEKEYRNQILNRIKSSDLINEEINEDVELNCMNVWSVIGEENSYHIMHNHGGHFHGISTVFYLEVPETNVEDDPENNIFLAMSTRPKSFVYHEDTSYSEINPEVGKLLIFPSWLLHGTYPQTKGIRQTFNINYRIVPVNKRDKSKNFSYH